MISQWVVGGGPTTTGVIVSNVITGGVTFLCRLGVTGPPAQGQQLDRLP